MKKYIIASIVGMGIMSGTVAHAADNEVTFLGAVNTTTCNLTTSVNGAVQPNQVVQLGTVAVNQEGTPVNFAMKPANPNDPGCKGLDASKTVTVSWASAALNADGFGATSGAATDATVMVNNLNAKTPNKAVNVNASTVEFSGDVLNTDGLKFQAKLKGGATEGDFKSVASFAVAYK
ncbi:fimbrial protein [Escherichia coli]|uniref:fimbrial protein n=8 Tax=Escherichia coli TaxID=562 RepID=UPI0007072B2E|nr:fimbrial protein [Escherichia coli]TVT12222.1 fimbrial protein [Enterococcus durans]EEU9537396.1 fimbrial protein [Escherichia coli]EFD5109001.1 fimbrial protein [Escherichia coli]EFH3439774.1 fimbrial protein [Escherichia coli]EGA3806029.1 fimbrial protein [Escherichia coli]